MNLKEKIQQDLKEASIFRREIEVSVLRLLAAALLNKEKEKRYRLKTEKDVPLSEEEVLEVLSSEAKKRREAILEFEKGGRNDLVEKEKQELKILQRYLPEQMSVQDLQKLVKEVIEKTGAKKSKDIGQVMAELMPQIKGRAQNELVVKIVKELLANNE